MREQDGRPQGGGKLTRRHLLPAAVLAGAGLRTAAAGPASEREVPPALARAVREIEPYLFTQEQFGDVSRGNPVPHSLSEEKRREVGLTRETWRLEVIADPEHP